MSGLRRGIGGAFGLLSGVGHDWAQNAEIEGAGALRRIKSEMTKEVNIMTYASLRELEPENEESLERIVEW